ncbi:MAG: hypothetical protein NW206_19750 [Hyphomonadaceae bacterium]|nr:hypothetical protein [Hyphomonadaceae bacterium]
MATKAELTDALERMLAAFGPGSFVPEKGEALAHARVALGRGFPWEKRRILNAPSSTHADDKP